MPWLSLGVNGELRKLWEDQGESSSRQAPVVAKTDDCMWMRTGRITSTQRRIGCLGVILLRLQVKADYIKLEITIAKNHHVCCFIFHQCVIRLHTTICWTFQPVYTRSICTNAQFWLRQCNDTIHSSWQIDIPAHDFRTVFIRAFHMMYCDAMMWGFICIIYSCSVASAGRSNLMQLQNDNDDNNAKSSLSIDLCLRIIAIFSGHLIIWYQCNASSARIHINLIFLQQHHHRACKNVCAEHCTICVARIQHIHPPFATASVTSTQSPHHISISRPGPMCDNADWCTREGENRRRFTIISHCLLSFFLELLLFFCRSA